MAQQDSGAGEKYGLRVGDWKLHRYGKKRAARNVVVEAQLANTKVSEFQLFHLAEDPSEKKNVIDEHPELAERMKSRLQKIIDNGRSRL